MITDRIFPLLFRDVTFRIPVTAKKLYLTFDDGPFPGITAQVLSLLEKHDAKATFFLCGKQVADYPELFRMITAGGHTAGNHGYLHLNGWKTGFSEYIHDVNSARKLVQSELFRPPYGKLKPKQYFYLRKIFRIVIWDVMCMDFDAKTGREKCFRNIVQYARPGSVIVFHDTPKAADNMLYALEQTLILFGRQGYRFESIPQEIAGK